MRHGNEGFILLDSLVCVFIVAVLTMLCAMIYKEIVNYDDGYIRYQEESNGRLADIFMSIESCEVCVIDESD